MGCIGNNDGGASPQQDAYAAISREQFEDYRNRYDPLLQRLSMVATDPAYVGQQADAAGEATGRMFAGARGSMNRNLARYQAQVAPDQRRTMDRIMTQAEVTADADVRNRARIAATDRQSAVRNDLIGIGQGIRQEAMGLYGSSASMENQRNVQTAQQRAQAEGALWQGGMSLGSAAIMGLMLSSRVAKHEIQDADPEDSLRTINGLRVKRYRYKPGLDPANRVRTGVIAEDAPEEIGVGGKAVEIGDTVFTTVGALQALDRKVARLERALKRAPKVAKAA